jgi:hypothetical protein
MRKHLALLVLAGACSQDITPPPVRNLDRPSAIAFACYGDLRITEEGASREGEVVVTAQPMASCLARLAGEVPEGQEDREGEPSIISPRSYAFVLQSARGTVAVIDNEIQAVLDSDPLTPGKNSIPIGTLPVALAEDRSGCFMVAANAGSCDLGTLDVTSALDIGSAAKISRIAITSAGGELMRAKPRTMVSGPKDETIGGQCPADPTGLLYIAYPACHLVAAVDARSGEIQAGIQFGEDGTATITDGSVSCPQECGDGAIVPTSAVLPGGIDASPYDAGPDAGPLPDAGPPTTDDGLPRPVALHHAVDGRLYIGSENSPLLTMVELDEVGLPAATVQMRLEGEVGVTNIDVSEPIEMGGESGTLGGSAGSFQFLYAVATDRTVRAVDLERNLECDTQVDPRFVHDERDVGYLACMVAGDPTTPPRRAGARSPGIHMPRDSVPLDVSFALVDPGVALGEPTPVDLVGTYAFITTSDGFVYLVNVDDDNYPDFEDEDDPLRTWMPLAMPHQIRDFVRGRNEIASNCSPPSAEPLELGPRLSEPPTTLVSEDRLSIDKLHLAPNLRHVLCTAGEDDAAMSELEFGAPVEVRERVYPDLKNVLNETFTFTWEGGLSRDAAGTDLDGPPVRQGLIEHLEGRVRLRDPSAPFCNMGVEPFDVVSLLGCDPSLGDAQCGIGEACYVHPDTPTVVPTGICMPAGKSEALSGLCREFLVTRRQYAARSSYSGELTLGHRRRVLRTSPVGGCTSNEQCEQMAAVEESLDDRFHPNQIDPGEAADLYDWVCVADPTRAPAPNRCLMSCEETTDCEAGLACKDGFCVEGVIPPRECVTTVQRYQVRGSDAFVVVGDRTGYLHDRIMDPDTSECVADPAANPLLVGRVPLTAPACTADDFTAVTPNPCSTTIDHTEVFTPYELEGDRCEPQPQELRTRDAAAIRYSNQALTMHLIDLINTGDAVCNGDRAGELPAFSTVYPGFQLSFTILGGFFPMFVSGVEAAFPIGISAGPDGRLWVLDEGDSSVTTAGRVFTLFPAAGSDGFAVIPIL